MTVATEEDTRKIAHLIKGNQIEALKAFFKEEGQYITSLNLFLKDLWPEYVAVILEGLRGTNVKSLDLGGNHLGPGCAAAIIAGLKGTNLTHFELLGITGLGPLVFAQIRATLEENKVRNERRGFADIIRAQIADADEEGISTGIASLPTELIVEIAKYVPGVSQKTKEGRPIVDCLFDFAAKSVKNAKNKKDDGTAGTSAAASKRGREEDDELEQRPAKRARPMINQFNVHGKREQDNSGDGAEPGTKRPRNNPS